MDTGVVERSDRIHALLKTTAGRHGVLLRRIVALPMAARDLVGDCRVGVARGEAESLAGWRLDVQSLDLPAQCAWRQAMFDEARVDLFASTHTCLPAMRGIARSGGCSAGVVNNGAAGMPNFTGDLDGLITPVGTTPSPHPALRELRQTGGKTLRRREERDAA